VFIVWIGVYPKPFLSVTEASVKQLLAQVHVRYRVEQTMAAPGSHPVLTQGQRMTGETRETRHGN